MATMIPETIHDKASGGEKKLFAILRDRLSHESLVWHNPKIKGLEADFVILSPTLGLLVIEVKGYFYTNIKKANRDLFTIERIKMRSLLHDDLLNPQHKKIEVYHFHHWAKKILGSLPNPKQVAENYDEHLGEKLNEKISNLSKEQKWDCILVDEAHTFLPEWLRCCVRALKDPENGSLTRVC